MTTAIQTALPEMAVCPLVEKAGWEEFRRRIKDVTLAWNYREWLNTCLLGGPMWKRVEQAGGVLESSEDEKVKVENEEEEKKRQSRLKTILQQSGVKSKDLDFFQAAIQFVNLGKMQLELDSRMPKRQKLWTWMVKSLYHPSGAPGPFHYLVEEIAAYDVAALYAELARVVDMPTILSQADELDAVLSISVKTSGDIFKMHSDMRVALKRLHDMNESIPERSRIFIPESFIRARLIKGMRGNAMYKSYLDKLMCMSPDEWADVKVETIFHHLELVSANSRDLQGGVATGPRNFNQQPNRSDGVVANVANASANKPTKKICFDFSKNGVCTRQNCKFAHEAGGGVTPGGQKPKQRPPTHSVSMQEEKKNTSGAQCSKCGNEGHVPKDCKFNGKCHKCGDLGHVSSVCKSKKTTRALMLDADGAAVVSNLMCVDDADDPGPPSILREPPVAMAARTDGKILEKFFADTGANRAIHPNARVASEFYRFVMDISTARGNNAMQSEGVGKMTLYTPKGIPMPGFDRVVFSKQAADKLASVGDICDGGTVCVFTTTGLKVYAAAGLTITGTIITEDDRCPKTRLYPLNLFRQSGPANVDAEVLAALRIAPADQTPKQESVSTSSIPAWPLLPAQIENNVDVCAALAKTYVKEGISDLDRYHAKLGDVGIKAMKRALPDLKIPKKYRCEFCIDGKIHKFEHKKCKEGDRTNYLPGECIHSDHSGPYTRSMGGARYSQLFLDRGSGYLWAYRMAKKTGHYDVLPLVIADAKAASRRDLRFFQTDGEGVFSGKATEELLLAAKVRHLWGAPYDSNTNPFIERARRTIFEGVCTSILRSGAPANFWGEAEAHKIFTMNVLPTFEDPENKGVFLSRKNLLEGDNRKFNLEHLMAFGTAATCYVPVERREGGKHPAHRRMFRGVIVGYSENTPAYRIWDLDAKIVKTISYNFTICHEGFYPFKDKSKWPEGKFSPTFYPTCDSPYDPDEWGSFDFDDEEASEVLAKISLPPGKRGGGGGGTPGTQGPGT
jgi:hypothetical protein